MTKQEAIEFMKKGGKVTHRYFTPGEWMTMKGHVIYFEDGVQVRFWEFWQGREEGWDYGYEEFIENKI